MPAEDPTQSATVVDQGRFATTHWTVVLEAGRSDSPQAAAALETLCRAYWYPLYSFVRRQVRDPQTAQDLTQEFFARLLAKDSLAGVDRRKGRFRSFLLAALKHFLADEWDRWRRLKRGGGQPLLSLDETTAEGRYRLEPAHDLTPERQYDRRYALTVLDRVLARLEEEFAAAGKRPLFEALQGSLVGDENVAPYTETGKRLHMSEAAVKVAAHRLRQRYRELLRAEIADTVASPAEIEDELRQLLAALA